MQSSINKIAIIGCGVIGTGWAIRFLANNKEVCVFEPNFNQRKYLLKEIKRTKKIVKKFYKKSKLNTKKLIFFNSIELAVKNADLIQENVPENLKIKRNIVKEISEVDYINHVIIGLDKANLKQNKHAYLFFKELHLTFKHWRGSSLVGLFGAITTACWFYAFSANAVAPVRALGQIELVIALLISVFFFKERPTEKEILAIFLLISSIILVIIYN